MSYPSRGPEWTRVQTLEDAIAVLESIDERRRVIREHAWHQSGNWSQVFVEATRMRKEVELLEKLLRERWKELFAVAIGSKE